MRKFFYFIILFLIVSCSTTKKVTEKVVLTDTVYVNKERVDTIVKFTEVKDSIYEKDSIDTKMRGDTLVITKYKYLYVQSKNAVKDKSVNTEKNDSVRTKIVYVDREVVKTKNKPLVWFRLLCGLILISCGTVIYRLWKSKS